MLTWKRLEREGCTGLEVDVLIIEPVVQAGVDRETVAGGETGDCLQEPGTAIWVDHELVSSAHAKLECVKVEDI